MTALVVAGPVLETRADEKPEVPAGAKMLPPNVARDLCVDCPLPKLSRDSLPKGRTAWAMVKICVDTAGKVHSTKVLKPISREADAEIERAIGKWKYRPFTIEGRPVPFCYIQRLDFT